MALFEMILVDKPFKLIKKGSKVVEVRLNDEKRKEMKTNDIIKFHNLSGFETIEKKIKALKLFKNFSELYDNYDNVVIGARGMSKEEFIAYMYQFYTPKQEEKYGALAIELYSDDDELRETFVFREIPFEGSLLKIRKDNILMPNGQPATREWMDHKGACAVVYVDENDCILLEKQFRYPFGRVVTEIPAGKLNSVCEDHKECAIREFEEETGLKSLDMTYLGQTALAMAYSNEIIYIYYTNKVEQGNVKFDEDELLKTFKIPFEEALKMCNDGTIIDSKTIIGINLYNNLVRKKKA